MWIKVKKSAQDQPKNYFPIGTDLYYNLGPQHIEPSELGKFRIPDKVWKWRMTRTYLTYNHSETRLI